MKALEKARLALRKHLENLSEEDKEALLLELDANRKQPKQVKENALLHNVSNCLHENTYPIDRFGNSKCHDCGKFMPDNDC